MNVDKITIVGGGSAGWMTAAMLIKSFPDKEIVLIESPNIPTVGVGESTIGGIKDYVQYLEIDEKDFFLHTDGSYKLSIKFTDFYEKNAGSFHYPFGKPFLDGKTHTMNDWFIKKGLYPEVPVNDFVRSYFPVSALYEKNKFALNPYGVYGNYDDIYDVAYHFDATKFALWLKDNYCLPLGVKYISAEVIDIASGDEGVESLTLTGGVNHTSDLFIDCTGFKSLLLGGALKEPFTSFNEMLPNNRAWATRLPYKNKDDELEPFTNCTAIGNGWVWNIPLWSRIGTGYVYSDSFISPEEALEEFKTHLCSDKMMYSRSREEVDQLEYRDIQMRVGIHERTWVKNVVAIGLSAGFIEPLESNGLFSVHDFLFKLIKSLLRGKVTQWDIDVYNTATRGLFNNFAEFVALHYALSVRDDTPYWQANNKRVYSPKMVRGEAITSVGFFQLQDKKMYEFNVAGNAGINWISTGMNYFITDIVDQTTFQNRHRVNYKTGMVDVFRHLEERKMYWDSAADKELSLNEYLSKNIYNT